MVIEAELNEIIQAAVNQRASDIYWLPTAEGYQVLVQAQAVCGQAGFAGTYSDYN